jgi:hypothetical protein
MLCALSAILFVYGCGGCRFYSAKGNWERLEGTDAVGTSQLALSMSPDGRYLLMLTVAKPSESAPLTWIHGVQTLDLSTGSIVEHGPSPEMDPDIAGEMRRYLPVVGFVDFFAEDGWHENRFYMRGAPIVMIDPAGVYYDAVRDVPAGNVRSSDCVDRGVLARFEDEARMNGSMTDAPLMDIATAGGGARSGFSAPAGVFSDSPAIYYYGYDNPGTVYRCDGSHAEVVFRNNPRFLLANPSLDMIKVSPDGKYLAAVYRKRMGLPIPSLGGAYELSVTELGGRRRTRYWKSEYFGSCVWDPTSTFLYCASSFKGLGVYRMRLESAF